MLLIHIIFVLEMRRNLVAIDLHVYFFISTPFSLQMYQRHYVGRFFEKSQEKNMYYR